MKKQHTSENVDRPLHAIMYCIAAHFSFSVMGACAKHLSNSYHVTEIVFYRNIFIFIPLLIFICFKANRHYFKTKMPKLVGLRAMIGGVSLIVTFTAISLLPISYASVLFFTSVLITPVLASFFLKEKIGLHRWSAIIIGFMGVMIVAQPSGAFSIIGLLCALAAAMLHASMFAVLRGLKSESPITITFYFVLIGWALPALFLPWYGQGLSVEHIPVIFLIAISGAAGQFFLVYTFRNAQASFITPFGYTALIWTSIFDLFIFKYDLDMTALLSGAALILSAQIYITYREGLRRKENDNE